MEPLARKLRNQLERAIVAARKAAEKGAVAAVDRLAVAHPEPFGHMAPAEKALRNRLRARARALGDPLEGKRQTIARLTREVAYEHWHRMLFARFLAENALLIHPDGVPVTLAECEELAREEGAPNGWALAERYAATMLPQIFRPDDPVLQVPLAPEDEQALERLLDGLPAGVFQADDSLGWCYQFWQSEEKKRVNESGEKITGETLPAVTQLFTEHYMVQFLLDNTLGAWWAGKDLTAEDAENAETEEELRRKLALPGADWEYLRFVRDDGAVGNPQSEVHNPKSPWRPAAGTFPGWPKAAKEVTVLDPCCGSGHFLVAALHTLVPMRMREEGLSERDACDAVLRDNLLGLEIDPRCTQIAAFALAFAAWRFPDAGGYRPLPAPQIACVGIGPQATEEQWLKLAEQSGIRMPTLGREPIKNGLLNLHRLFSQAPTLGSLINPAELPADLIAADYETIQPYLAAILSAEEADDETRERAIAAAGMVKAADLLAGEYSLVVTNVPFLGYREMNGQLLNHVAKFFPDEKGDLGYCLWRRFQSLAAPGQTTALVTLQHWLSLRSYTGMRETLLTAFGLRAIVHLGTGAFETISGAKVNIALAVATRLSDPMGSDISLLDAASCRNPRDKARCLREDAISRTSQKRQYANPDHRISFGALTDLPCLSVYADCLAGIMNGDSPKFIRTFWEMPERGELWAFLQSTVSVGTPIGGLESIILFDERNGHLREDAAFRRIKLHNADERGNSVWGRPGVAISQMSSLPASRYFGNKYDSNVAAIVPRRSDHLVAVWTFCSSEAFFRSVRAIDRKLNVTNATFGKVPFDLAHWQKVAAEKYPDGLPEPESDDPTQWLFHGRPEESVAPVQVGVARLLGYRWPAELDDKMHLSKRARELVNRCDELARFADDDGVVCLPSVGGERPGADRVRTLLAAAFGAEWSPAKEAELLAGVGYEGKTLDDWLRDAFFDQHCKLFHQRPFIWHVWDGRRDGFAALVNYHRLDRRLLERLAFSYVNDWIRRQEGEVRSGVGGSEARLAAAQELQGKLALILEGEAPYYDIFVRWKPLEQQPIGWEPDFNDGVRMNIRPFVEAGILRKTPNIHWRKDRGKEPERPKAHYPWFWGWDEKAVNFAGGNAFDGNRWNDLHYTREAKQQAREAAKKEGKP